MSRLEAVQDALSAQRKATACNTTTRRRRVGATSVSRRRLHRRVSATPVHHTELASFSAMCSAFVYRPERPVAFVRRALGPPQSSSTILRVRLLLGLRVVHVPCRRRIHGVSGLVQLSGLKTRLVVREFLHKQVEVLIGFCEHLGLLLDLLLSLLHGLQSAGGRGTRTGRVERRDVDKVSNVSEEHSFLLCRHVGAGLLSHWHVNGNS